MEDQAYLDPDFDPSSLTVPRIRSILVAHSVNYPSSAKKSQLIELFNEYVRPQAGKLRAASLRVKRTSKGIIDAESTTGDDEDDENSRPPSSTSGGRRVSSRARTEEPLEVPQSTRSTRHSTAPPESTPRRVSAKRAHPVETIEEQEQSESRRPAVRKSRLSTATPIARKIAVHDDSPFSNENVFQSGGSPPSGHILESARRRTTTSVARDAERRRSDALRRRTQDAALIRPQVDGVTVPTRKTFEAPTSIMNMQRHKIEPGEEFTPEEETALTHARQNGETAVVRRRPAPASGAARTGVSAVGIALLAGIAMLWGQEKFQVGYCGVGHHSQEIAGIEIPEWADVIRPQCEPCPAHASFCGERLQTDCEPGFLLQHHPLSLGGKLPLPPTCEPDSLLTRKVESVKQRALEELREQNAEYECSKSSSPVIKETVLKAKVSSQRRKGMTNEEFEALWESALPEIRKADEVIEGVEGKSGEFTLRSRSLARISLGCAIRRSILTTLREYLRSFVIACATITAAGYLRYSVVSSRRDEARAQQLARVALNKLSIQAALHARDPSNHRETYLPVAQLRDDVLRDEFSSMRRQRLWNRVQRKVEHNANVRPMVREGRSGDVGRVWEWIGAVDMLEGGRSSAVQSPATGVSSRPRVSFGDERLIEPSQNGDSELGMSEIGSSRWNEAGQYY